MEVKAQTLLPEHWVNPSVLRWARTRMGLERHEVETRSKIPSNRIVAWEEALDSPLLDELEILADIYDCPVGYFFLDFPPDIKSPLDFRGLAPEKAEKLSYETHVNLNKFVHLTDFLASLSEKMGVERNIRIDASDLTDSIQSIANREREKFGFTAEIRGKIQSPDDAFDFWREAIEEHGVFVISLKLIPSEVRGASRWAQHHTPAILVNRNDMEAATGRCFTLLHEWAHLLIKQPGFVCDFRGQETDARIEHFTNALAAELLVPRKEFEEVLQREGLFTERPRWGDATIDRIRRHFWVSKDVIAIRIEESKLAPTGFYRTKRAAWDRLKPFFRSKKGSGQHHPTKIERRLAELGVSTVKYVSAAYNNNAVSKLDLADFLDMKTEQAEGFVSWVQKIPKNRNIR